MKNIKYQIGICDDEEFWRNQIYNCCRKMSEDQNIKVEYHIFSSGKELLEGSADLDILFLDEEMGDSSGLQIKEGFEKVNRDTMIVFITSHTEILYESFGRNVYGFLNKPVCEADFKRLWNKLVKRLESQSYIETYDAVCGKVFIPCKSIWYIEAETSYSNIIYGSQKEKIIVRKTLGEIENEMMFQYIVRTHKSYMVNLMHECKLDLTHLTIEQGDMVIPIARRRKKEVEKVYAEMLIEKANMVWNI